MENPLNIKTQTKFQYKYMLVYGLLKREKGYVNSWNKQHGINIKVNK